MNQILFTSNNKNNYNKIDTKKIIRIFAIALLVVAIIIVAMKVYGIYQEKKNVTVGFNPEITITSNNTKEATIKVTCAEGIQYLVYTWNDEDENRVNLNGSTSFERMVRIPEEAINTLKVEVASLDGVIKSKTEVFENSIDNEKPIVDSITIVDKKLNIEVSDNKGIKYLAYKWENEEEVIINVDENDNMNMIAQIDIQRGTYKLQIRIVDIYENEEILSRLVTGVNEPEIKVIKYGDTVNVCVTHDMGFKKIEFIINNSVYVYDENFSRYDKNKTEISIDFPLKEGENKVQVNAYSFEKMSDDAEETLENYAFKRFTGECTYEP